MRQVHRQTSEEHGSPIYQCRTEKHAGAMCICRFSGRWKQLKGWQELEDSAIEANSER